MAAKNGSAQFEARLTEIAALTETLLDRLLEPGPAAGERARPARLLEAMRYASLRGGKRFRPFLVVESAALFAVPQDRSLMAGAALECVHCYSLVHDDLPAMDNDALRRGQPTVHLDRQFGYEFRPSLQGGQQQLLAFLAMRKALVQELTGAGARAAVRRQQ